MKELFLFLELRLKDYLTIGLILLAVFCVMNLQSFVGKHLPKNNPLDFEMELLANVIQVKVLHQKSETLEGSKLKGIGYNLIIEYQIDSILISKDLIIKYNEYKAARNIIDRMVLTEDKLLPIRIKKKDYTSVILNTIENK